MKSSKFFLATTSLFILSFSLVFSQGQINVDSVAKALHHDVDPADQGVSLIKAEKYDEANQLFTNEIKKDESNRDAYFNRGVVSYSLNNTANACRDWSAVLALGDTAMFKLLDKNCHGSMVIDEDTIPSSQYHKMFADEKKTAKTPTANSATIIADQMPEFPGGTDALLDYFQKNIKFPESARSKGIAGTVYVNFIVSRKGKILFPYIQRGIETGCNEEALRIVKNMPAWKPGKLKGKPIPVRFNLPVRFSQR